MDPKADRACWKVQRSWRSSSREAASRRTDRRPVVGLALYRLGEKDEKCGHPEYVREQQIDAQPRSRPHFHRSHPRNHRRQLHPVSQLRREGAPTAPAQQLADNDTCRSASGDRDRRDEPRRARRSGWADPRRSLKPSEGEQAARTDDVAVLARDAVSPWLGGAAAAVSSCGQHA